MFRVFNMGVGFCVVVDPGDRDRVVSIARRYGRDAWQLGHVVADRRRRLWLTQPGLEGEGLAFRPVTDAPP